MAKTYTKADEKTVAIIIDMMSKHHPKLHAAKVRITPLIVTSDNEAPAVGMFGRGAAAKIRTATVVERTIGSIDVVLLINGDTWKDANKSRRSAIIDHELSHLEVIKAEDGPAAKVYADGRPKIATVPDDFLITGFFEVIQRHKLASLEAENLRQVTTEVQKMFPFMSAA